jgi:3' terminal RNA ribose 2'-O-methyltransferase Hen1
MFLSISVKGEGADNLSHIVQKHPAKPFERGNAKLFFPVYDQNKVNMVIYAEFPEYRLWNADIADADAYVTSREYALSSLFCRELKHVLNTVLSGTYKSEEDKKKAETPMDYIIEALPLATGLDNKRINSLFAPLGYEPVKIESTIVPSIIVDHSLQFPWQPQKNRALGLVMTTRKTLREIIQHLLILIPVIDNYTHYTTLDPLVEELAKYGGAWLDAHPQKDFIRARFLRFKKALISKSGGEVEKKESESDLEKRINLGEMRVNWFSEKVKALGVRSVVDAGCGSGRLAERFVKDGVFEVTAFDCSTKAVRTAMKFLSGKGHVFFGSLIYSDARLMNKDVFCLQEVIEHLSPWQFQRSMEVLFGAYRPKHIIMSTPNVAYNSTWGIPDGTLRHWDHKFEFNHSEVERFALTWANAYGYDWVVDPIGLDYQPVILNPKDADVRGATVAVAAPVGVAPTFGIVFTRKD